MGSSPVLRAGLCAAALGLVALGPAARADDFDVRVNTAAMDTAPQVPASDPLADTFVGVDMTVPLPMDIPYRSPTLFTAGISLLGLAGSGGHVDLIELRMDGEVLRSTTDFSDDSTPPPGWIYTPLTGAYTTGALSSHRILDGATHQFELRLVGRRRRAGNRFTVAYQAQATNLHFSGVLTPSSVSVRPTQTTQLQVVPAATDLGWTEETFSPYVSDAPQFAAVDASGLVTAFPAGLNEPVTISVDWSLVPGQSTPRRLECQVYVGWEVGDFYGPHLEIQQLPPGVLPAGTVATFTAPTPEAGTRYEWLDGITGAPLGTTLAPVLLRRVDQSFLLRVHVFGSGANGASSGVGYLDPAYGVLWVEVLEPPPPPNPVPDTQGPAESPNDNTVTWPPCSVMLHDGEQRFSRTDLVIPGRGDAHFVFARRYRSRVTWDGPLGFNWDYNLDERVVLEDNGDVLHVDGGARVERWVALAGGLQAPRGRFSSLRQQPDQTWVLRYPDGMKHVFRADGLLEQLVDRHGNRLLLQRNDSGQLVRVLDAYDRPIDFTWEGRYLRKIRDFLGREVIYTQDAQGDLVEARTPVVTGTSIGDDFPAGRVERYTYSGGYTDPRSNHNLLTVTRPEEVAVGGAPYLSWTYGINPANEDEFDRVLIQDHGGTNASGVAAGGRSFFAWERQNQAAPAGDAALPRMKTTVTDRNGNVTEYFANEFSEHVLVRRLTRGFRPGDPPVFEERREFDAAGLLVRRVFPAGNEVRFVYDTGGPRAARSNVLEVRRIAGPRGGGADLVTRMTYEPLFQRLASITDPRGLTTGYTPPLGAASAARYTATFVFDYQEHSNPVPEAVTFGIDLSSVARGLGDQNGDGRTDQAQGNVVRARAPSVLLRADSLEAVRLGTTTQEIVSETVWNDRGQPLSTVDPEGHVTVFEHNPANDPDADGVVVDGVPAGELSGYLKSVTVDATTSPRRRTAALPTALETSFRYDPVGNLTAVTNPRGVTTAFEVNALNEVVKITRGADVSLALATGQLPSGEAAFQYVARLFHDHNGRVVRREVEDRDGSSDVLGGFAERSVVYDILDNPVEVTVEVDQLTRLTTRMRYDLNENLQLVTAPAGNKVRFLWDERDLALEVVRGADALEEARVRFEVDRNGNRTRTIDAEDTDGNGQPEATTLTFDGFDRLVAVTDALGNRAEVEYDPAGSVVRRRMLGHPAALPGNPNVLLSDQRLSPDELGRVFRADTALFLAQGFAPVRPVALLDGDGDGWVTSFAEYDALSRAYAAVEDDGQVSRVSFDGASRLLEALDALGNRRVSEYDRNSNPIRVTSFERSPEGLVPEESFTTRYVWDQLDRLVRATDNAGQTARFSYDSRDNLVQRSDPVGPLVADPLGLFPGQINDAGNTCTYVYDGLDRLLQTVCDLRQGGQGGAPLDLSNAANPDGKVTLTQLWDANSRLSAIVDDKGQATSFGYDAQDRKVTHTWADGAVFRYVWDKDSNLRQTIDPNGSIATRTFDALSRLVRVQVQRAAGVGGSTDETYAWDGMSRLVRATDDNGGAPGAAAVVERVWDSLSRLLEERQDGRVVSASWSGDGKRLALGYPGGRSVGFAHDALDRVKTISDAGPGGALLADYAWIGPGMRPLARAHGNGTALSLISAGQDVGYDAVQRVVRLRHLLPGGGAAFVDREYGYDRASNRAFERRLDELGLVDRYSYDSTYRVVASADDEQGPAGAARRELTGIAYRYDGVGNRVEETQEKTTSGNGGARLALQADERIQLGPRSQVEGDVVADGQERCSHGRRRCGCRQNRHRRSDVSVGPEARVAGSVTGQDVALLPRARVEGDVHASRLQAHPSASIGGALLPFLEPEPLPDVEPIAHGHQDVLVRRGQQVVLLAGAYRDVEVQHGARLVLAGGGYALRALRVGPGATVDLQGAATVRTACRLDFQARSVVVPAAGLEPSAVRWETLDRESRVGAEARLFGVLVAPDGEVELDHGAQVQGQVLAEKIKAGPGVSVSAPQGGGGGGGGGGTQTVVLAYTVNAVNEYTTIGSVTRGHDPNGNLRDDGTRLFLYDYRNRLIGVSRKSDGAPIAAYRYDALGRRVEKTVYSQQSPGAVEKVTRFCWDGWDLIEEQSAAGITESTYVCGVGVDEHVQWVRTPSHPLGAGTFYLHQDARGSVVAVTDQGGAVVDKVRYDDFGGADHPSAVGLALGFQGRYLDAETGLYEFRHRVYDPATGRFLQRDPVWDPANFGGQYTFVGNGPVSRMDPLGLADPFPPAQGPVAPDDAFTLRTRELVKEKMVDYLVRERGFTKEGVEGVMARAQADVRWAQEGWRAMYKLIPNSAKAVMWEAAGKQAATEIRAAAGPGGGRVVLFMAVLGVGVFAVTGEAGAAEVAVTMVAPTTAEAAFERGEKGTEYLPEAGWDVIRIFDPSMGGLTGATEKSIDFWTQAKEPVHSFQKIEEPTVLGALWDMVKTGFISANPAGAVYLAGEYGQQGVEDFWWYYRNWDKYETWDEMGEALRTKACKKQ